MKQDQPTLIEAIIRAAQWRSRVRLASLVLSLIIGNIALYRIYQTEPIAAAIMFAGCFIGACILYSRIS